MKCYSRSYPIGCTKIIALEDNTMLKVTLITLTNRAYSVNNML